MSVVRSVRLAAAPGEGAAVEAVLQEMVSAIRARPGCQGATAYGDPQEGAYGLFVVWDTIANADGAREVIAPRLFGALQDKLREAPDIRMFRVLEAAAAPRREALRQR